MSRRYRGTSGFVEFSYFLLGPQQWMAGFLEELSPLLKKAGIYVTIDVYAAAVVLATILGTIFGGAILFVISFILFPTSPFLMAILTVLGLVVGAVSGFISMMIYPRARAFERRLKLADEMPYAVSQMAALAAAGMTPERIFRELAGGDPKEVITEQMTMIVRDIDLFGKDVVSAIDSAIIRAPNPVFSGFLQGFKAAIVAGTDIAAYLTDFASDLMTEKRIAAKMLSETLGVFSEMYTVLLIVFPIVMVIMLTLMAVLSPQLGGFAITDVLFFITYVAIPLFGVMFIILVDAMMPKR